ncbi:MAG: NYN domain-containing protein [Pseudomonadota bacterium]
MTHWLGVHPDDRAAILIDGANLYKTARTLGFDIDYKALLARTNKTVRLLRASYYTAMQEDREQDYSPLRPLIDWLDYNGYHMVTKPMKEFTDAAGQRRFKGSTDVELAVDIVQTAEQVDHLVVFTGNGEFRRAIRAAQEKGARVTIVSTIKTQPPMAADDLRRQADVFVDLADLEDVVGRKGGPVRRTRPQDDDYDDDYEDGDEDFDE